MKKAILKLKDDLQRRKDFGEYGRKFLEKNMNLEKNVTKYEELFGIISKGGDGHIHKDV